MRDVVIVPTYERPEYAWVCLEYLSRAHDVEDKEIWLCQDNHIDAPFKLSKVLSDRDALVNHMWKLFPKRSCWYVADPHDTYGNSKNLVDSLRRAYESGAERIYLVEDDIMVAPDIFQWHDAILSVANPLVSCATAVNKSAHFPINGRYAMDETVQDPSAYYVSEKAYSSHASAFKSSKLGHLLDFLSSWKWSSGCEQDLLTQRFLSVTKQQSVWPYVPRAFNVGMYSYHINTAMKFNGTLEEKVNALRQTITDADKLYQMSAGNQAITAVPTTFDRSGMRRELKELKRYR